MLSLAVQVMLDGFDRLAAGSIGVIYTYGNAEAATNP